jgi:transcriptional regulator with XRE-family HTH domain
MQSLDRDILKMAQKKLKLVNFAENVRRLRKEKELSQSELAKAIGAHPNHITRIENGRYIPALDTVMKLAEVFQVPLDYLVSGSNGSPEAIHIEDQAFAEKMRLLNSLDKKEREAITLFIDSVLSQKKLLAFAKEIAS